MFSCMSLLRRVLHDRESAGQLGIKVSKMAAKAEGSGSSVAVRQEQAVVAAP